MGRNLTPNGFLLTFPFFPWQHNPTQHRPVDFPISTIGEKQIITTAGTLFNSLNLLFRKPTGENLMPYQLFKVQHSLSYCRFLEDSEPIRIASLQGLNHLGIDFITTGADRRTNGHMHVSHI